jgi:hypothetical protein
MQTSDPEDDDDDAGGDANGDDDDYAGDGDDEDDDRGLHLQPPSSISVQTATQTNNNIPKRELPTKTPTKIFKLHLKS